MKYEVRMFTLCDGWINTWMVCEDGKTEPETFNTREDAQTAIDEFIEEVNREIERGERPSGDGYSEEDFQIFKNETKHTVL